MAVTRSKGENSSEFFNVINFSMIFEDLTPTRGFSGSGTFLKGESHAIWHETAV
jgi:hypothetical protein